MNYRVLHVLDHSLPVVSGYSIRSASILEAQKQLGHNVLAVTGPLHEMDDCASCDGAIDEITYFRSRLPSGLLGSSIRRRWLGLRELSIIDLLRRRIKALLDSEPIDLIHAHSPALCGIAALCAGWERHVPVVYEIRAFWEDAAVDQNRISNSSLRYRLSRYLENAVLGRADAVVGISSQVLEDLTHRGIDKKKLFHVPNGVHASRVTALPPQQELASRLGIGGEPVLGFIGSLYRYEGISWMLTALPSLKQSGLKFKVLIIGDGEDLPAIRKLVGQLDAGSYVMVLGPVPREEVRGYYSLMDVLVYPRLSTRLTESITPLKPLEAMAQEKAVLASSVGGIRELVEGEVDGLLFQPADVEDFCRQARRLITDRCLRQRLGGAGRRTVVRTKDWPVLARRYDEVYESAICRQRPVAGVDSPTPVCGRAH